jgi:radical SAM superfamily enzyme YgiQ (UPF0313 family)
MRKKILLINPWIHDFAAYDFWSKPIGLLYLASILRKNGHDIRFIDCLNPHHPAMKNESRIKIPKRRQWGNGKYPTEAIEKPDRLRDFPRRYNRYGITPQVFKEELLKSKTPDMVFVTSMMTYWYPGVFEVIDITKGMYPDSTIVLGGNYATLCTEHAMYHSGADMIITGEGEKHLRKLCDLSNFVPDFKNLDSYPYPAFDLLSSIDQIPIMTSRGCPFRCTYCASHLLNDGFRTRDPMSVVDEIEFWNKTQGVINFSIYDDAFLVDSAHRAVPIMKEILRRQLKCHFHCPNGLHLREITDDVSRLMFLSGFKTVRFGFETSSIRRQLETGGKVTNDETVTAIENLKNNGYRSGDIGIYILCGLPGQSAQEVRESIAFIRSLGARPIIAEYSPIPGTGLWNEAIALSPFNIREEPLFQNNTLLPCRSEILTYEMYRALKNEMRMASY